MSGSLTTGVVLGTGAAVVALLPAPLDVALAVALGALASLVAVVNGAGFGDRLPQARRLVPASVLGRASSAPAIQFGFEMGSGYRTFSPSGLPLMGVLFALGSGGLVAGTVVWLGFGLGRSAFALGRNLFPVPEKVDAALNGLVVRARVRWVASAAVLAMGWVVIARVISG